VLYKILIEFGVPMKPVRLNKMCLNETHTRVRRGLTIFLAKIVQRKGNALSTMIFNFALEYAIRKVQETRWREN
jgi:hypothetical protein